MEKFHRNERLAVLMKTLCDSPGETLPLEVLRKCLVLQSPQ